MAAFIIVRIKINDVSLLDDYQKIAPDIVAKYEGKYLAIEDNPVTLEGEEEKRRIVLLRFPTMSRAKEFFDSNEYQEAMNLRKDISTFEMVAVEGI